MPSPCHTLTSRSLVLPKVSRPLAELRVDLGMLLTDYQDPFLDVGRATYNPTSALHETLGPGQPAPKMGAQRYNAPLPGFS